MVRELDNEAAPQDDRAGPSRERQRFGRSRFNRRSRKPSAKPGSAIGPSSNPIKPARKATRSAARTNQQSRRAQPATTATITTTAATTRAAYQRCWVEQQPVHWSDLPPVIHRRQKHRRCREQSDRPIATADTALPGNSGRPRQVAAQLRDFHLQRGHFLRSVVLRFERGKLQVERLAAPRIAAPGRP